MILDKIVGHKLKELEYAREHIPLQELKAQVSHLAPTRDFRSAIGTLGQIDLIAEIKKNRLAKGLFDKILIISRLLKYIWSMVPQRYLF